MSESNKRHFLLNLVYSYGYTILSSLLGIISVPLALVYWKAERYGIWTVITSFAIYLGVSGLGIDCAAGILMTKNSGYQDKMLIFKRGLRLLLISSLVFAVFFLVAYLLEPDWLKIIGKMSTSNFVEAKLTATVFIVFFLVNLPLGIFATSFAAFEKAYLNSFFNMLSCVLLFAILFLTVSLRFNLVTYGVLYGCANVLVNLIRIIAFRAVLKSKREIVAVHTAVSHDSRYSTILGTGVRLTLYGLAGVVSANVSSLIISNVLGVAEVVPYSLVYKLLNIAFAFLYGFNASMSPLMGKEFGLHNWEWIVKTYNRMFLITVFLASLIVVGSALFLDDIILAWVGPGKYVGVATTLVLSLWFFIGGLSNINYMVINAFNYTKGMYLVTWTDTIIFLLSSFLLVKVNGVLGVSLALLLGAVMISLWVLPLMVFKRSGGRLKYNFRYLIINVAVAICFIAGGVILRHFIQSFFLLFSAKIAFLLSYAAVSYMFLPQEIRIEAKALLRKRSNDNNGE